MTKPANSLKEVANLAGVSMATVSRVLAGKSYVNEETRIRVQSVIKECGYRPNVMARGLKMGRSKVIALMIPSIENLIFPPIVRGAGDAAVKRGYIVNLCNTDESSDTEKTFIQSFCNRGVDGLVIATMREESEHVRQLQEEGFPIVLAVRNISSDMDAVVIDNRKGAREMTDYLISRGYHKIAFALGSPTLTLYGERLEGYRESLEAHGIAYDRGLVMIEQGSPDSLTSQLKALLGRTPDLEAVFASTDYRAVLLMQCLREMGRAVPEDIAVVGFDDVELSRLVSPPLTTVHQPLYEIGYQAVMRLIDQIEQKEKTGEAYPAFVQVLPTQLVLRTSTK